MKLSRGLIISGVIGIIILILVGWVAGGYNSLVGQRNNVDNKLAALNSAYQRRFDLVPQLVNVAQSAQIQEQKVFGDIADARTRYSGASTPEARAQAGSQLDGALSRLLVIVENYPQLSSNQTLQNLMIQLEGTENRVKVERDNYSTAATGYNTSVQRFPTNILAGMFGFDKKPLFEAQSGAENAPEVDLNTDGN